MPLYSTTQTQVAVKRPSIALEAKERFADLIEAVELEQHLELEEMRRKEKERRRQQELRLREEARQRNQPRTFGLPSQGFD